jgi:hypothetical protein
MGPAGTPLIRPDMERPVKLMKCVVFVVSFWFIDMRTRGIGGGRGGYRDG